MVACLLLAACGGGGESKDDSGLSPVETDVKLPGGAKFALKLKGPVEGGFDGEGIDRFERMLKRCVNPKGGESGYGECSSGSDCAEGEVCKKPMKLGLNGVNDVCENFNLQMVVPASEGETGTFGTIQTSSFTCKSTQYVTSEPIRLTIDEYGNGKLSGALKGKFAHKRQGSDKTSVSPALTFEGRFSFSY